MARATAPMQAPNITNTETLKVCLGFYEFICQRVIYPSSMPEIKYLPSRESSRTEISATSLSENMTTGSVLEMFKKTMFRSAEKTSWSLILALMQVG